MSGEETAPVRMNAGGVIHDLGYRGYDGPMRSTGAIAWSLFTNGLAHAYGIGRTGRAKFRPFALLGAYLIPAVVIVGILGFGVLQEMPTRMADYATTYQILVSVFAATQAPVLFSRDLRYRSIVLYLARPLTAKSFALVRYVSMTAAVWLFLLAPVLLLYFGGLLTGLDAGTMHRDLGVAVLTTLLLAAAVAAITGVVSSWTPRPGLAIVVSIGVLLLGSGIVGVVQALSSEGLTMEGTALGGTALGEAVGIFSPYTLAAGVGHLVDERVMIFLAPASGAMSALYVAVAVIGPIVGVLLIQQRFVKAVAR